MNLSESPSSFGRESALIEPGLFWFWNANPTRELICRQLDAFCEKSIRALYLHPMPDGFRYADFHGGMEMAYPGDEYFEWVAFTCREMKARGMLLWLYDEGGWPSGVAQGAVVAHNPDFGWWAMRDGGETFHPQPELGYPDLMNPQATQSFIGCVHEKYRVVCGEEFGQTIPGIFTDEPRLCGRVGSEAIPWSPLLPEAFAAQHGFALERVLPLLFKDGRSSPEALRAQQQYRATLSTLIARNYYGEIRRWCDANHLLFIGHHSGEDAWAHHGLVFGDYMEQAREYSIPGVDAIWRQVFPGQAGGNYVGLAASSAWVNGKKLAASEMFAVYGTGLTLHQMHWIAAHHLVRGVNVLGFMYALLEADGARRIGTCSPDFSPRSLQWRHLDLLIETVRRAAQFSLQGEARPRAGVFYRSELVPPEEDEQFMRQHERLCDHLHDAAAGVLFVGLESLRTAHVEGGEIVVGAMRLAVLAVHHGDALSPEEEAALQKLEDSGARILRNVTPEAIPLGDWSQLKFESAPPRGLRVLPLQDGDDWRFLLFNSNPYAVELRFRFPQMLRAVALEEWGCAAEYSLQRKDDGYHWKLHAGQLAALETGETSPHAPRDVVHQQALDGGWQMREVESLVIEDAICVEDNSSSWRECELGDYSETHREFSGTLAYCTTLQCPTINNEQQVLLDLGNLFSAAEVEVNGIVCGRRAWAPCIFDITAALQQGENDLEIRVTNTLANQWARPEVRARDFAEYSNAYLERSAPFIDESIHAGLSGPVILRISVSAD
jgi:hypothetical protein